MTRSVRVLIVEDNEINRLIISEVLSRAGYHALPAANGSEAINLVRAHPLDIVLMDCHMPAMDGCETAGIIRQCEQQGWLFRSPKDGLLPILGMLANPTADDDQLCRDAGMDGVLAKPIDPDELVQRIQSILFGHDDTFEPAPPPINVSALMDRCLGDPVFVERLLQKFEVQAREVTRQLQNAIDTNDSAAVHVIASDLKASASDIAADPLQKLALQIERLSRDGLSRDAGGAMKSLESEIARCLDFVPRVLGTTQAKL